MSSGRILNRDSGDAARVSESGRVWTYSSTETIAQTAVEHGEAFNINTGLLTLTDGSDSSVMYLKNTDPLPFFISALAVGVGTLDAPTERALITMVRNPTGGTIISNASNVAMNQNRNFTSNVEFRGLAYKGGQGVTCTGGSDIAIFHTGSNQRLFATIDFLLPRGTSVGIHVALNNANGGSVYAAIVGHYYDEGV